MRFGISATSLILPKNLRMRLRPTSVWAIVSTSLLITADRAPHTGRRVNRMTHCCNGQQQRTEKWDLLPIPTAAAGILGPRTDTTAPGRSPGPSLVSHVLAGRGPAR